MIDVMPNRRDTSLIHRVISQQFGSVADKPCWNVRQGHGSSITFEFGIPSVETSPVSGTPPRRLTCVRGEWHLWIWCCHWAIQLADKTSAHSESSRTEIERALVNLQGQMITNVSVEPSEGRSLFEFDLGGVLRTWPYNFLNSDGQPYQNWMFFEQNEHRVLTYYSDGKYSYGPSDSGDNNILCP